MNDISECAIFLFQDAEMEVDKAFTSSEQNTYFAKYLTSPKVRNSEFFLPPTIDVSNQTLQALDQAKIN